MPLHSPQEVITRHHMNEIRLRLSKAENKNPFYGNFCLKRHEHLLGNTFTEFISNFIERSHLWLDYSPCLFQLSSRFAEQRTLGKWEAELRPADSSCAADIQHPPPLKEMLLTNKGLFMGPLEEFVYLPISKRSFDGRMECCPCTPKAL